MWPDIVKYLALFESAVLTGHDAEGYPFSVRCKPQIDDANQLLRLSLAADLPFQAGPAGLLYHSHYEQMWNLKSFLVRGRLERESGGWLFRPQQFIMGAGLNGQLGEFKFLLKCRRVAAAYLQKRGVTRPQVQWDAIKKLQAEAAKRRG